ncbi:MAG: hypothetical protein M3Q05_07640, partial [Bacteroidota bacterium]|nr:hypothetical protein [Bacteroidota bacterium]
YHNNNDGNNRGHQHYGADPNSAYRNANINFGDNRDHRRDSNHNYDQNQVFGQNNSRNQQHWPADRGQQNYRHEERVNDNQFNQNNWNRNNYNQDNRHNQGNRYQNDRYQNNRNDNTERYDVNRYMESDNRFYAGEEPRMFDDRKQFAAEDYRYGSGNRHWESPGHDDDYDADNDRNGNRRRNHDQNDNRGFFGRIADQVREDWRTFTNPDDDRNQQGHDNRNQWRSDFRNSNRGYESGPRWADEDDSRRRNNERRPNRDYDEDNRRW